MKVSAKFRLQILIAAGVFIVLLAAAAFVPWQKNGGNSRTEIISPKSPPEKKPVSVIRTDDGWWESRRMIYFDIPARIRYYLPEADRPAAKDVAQKAWDAFARIGRVFNPSDPDSETGRLNAADKTDPVAVSEDLFCVLEISERLWQASNGAFDPTMGPVKTLWEQAVKDQKIPSDRRIQSVLARTGFDHVLLKPEQNAVVCTKNNITFDFGGIAKGFAVDRVRDTIKDEGIRAGLVQLGGEIAAFGSKGNTPWRIGVQHPTDMQEIWGLISGRGSMRVSTSGNYRQPLVIQGHAFYHIFSPETGKPVSEKVLGVTTASLNPDHSSAMLDAAATAITIMGREKGLNLAEKLGIQALVLTRGGEGNIVEHHTGAFADVYSREPGAGS
ncbi:MAG: FAD:protein FMN transferase [Desulfobacterales bacterium]|nr:FAD:protein FMN transferase [Desulfobacterales bacterium]MBS3756301.1 FAD:protein FMN transferase [Desulfobacterales bacterium]